MKIPVLLAAVFLAGLSTSALASNEFATVLSVDSAECTILKSNPPQLWVSAKGKVNSSGWTDGQLSPFVYINPPKDGYWDMSFIARKPNGTVIWQIDDIDGDSLTDMPVWVKGVRIHASTNKVEVPCPSGGASAAAPQTGQWKHK